MTVAQAMEQFIAGLQISEREEEDARRQRDVLRRVLERPLSVREFVISGSFSRHTAIRPLHDIDLFVVLDPYAHARLADGAPLAVLTEIQRVLDAAYQNKHSIIQNRSVNIAFAGTGLAFDVVPAFPDGAGYRIPDRDTNTWIRTNPRIHSDHAEAANERAGRMAKPLVKALKHWRAQHKDVAVRSFHLELMVYDLARAKPESYARGIATLLRQLAARVMAPTPEPAGIGPAVDVQMSTSEHERAAALFSAAAALADEALTLAAQGYTGHAHHAWRSLLGQVYPEAGIAPTAGSSVAVGATRMGAGRG